MQIGSLVKHIEFGYIGIATKQGVSTCDKWYIIWTDPEWRPKWNGWCTECELELICK